MYLPIQIPTWHYVVQFNIPGYEFTAEFWLQFPGTHQRFALTNSDSQSREQERPIINMVEYFEYVILQQTQYNVILNHYNRLL